MEGPWRVGRCVGYYRAMIAYLPSSYLTTMASISIVASEAAGSIDQSIGRAAAVAAAPAVDPCCACGGGLGVERRREMALVVRVAGRKRAASNRTGIADDERRRAAAAASHDRDGWRRGSNAARAPNQSRVNPRHMALILTGPSNLEIIQQHPATGTLATCGFGRLPAADQVRSRTQSRSLLRC